jgi:hypothetical protein
MQWSSTVSILPSARVRPVGLYVAHGQVAAHVSQICLFAPETLTMCQIVSIKAMSQFSGSQVTMTRHSSDRPSLDLAVRKMESRQRVMHHLKFLIPQEIYKPTEVHRIP